MQPALHSRTGRPIGVDCRWPACDPYCRARHLDLLGGGQDFAAVVESFCTVHSIATTDGDAVVGVEGRAPASIRDAVEYGGLRTRAGVAIRSDKPTFKPDRAIGPVMALRNSDG
jgi:hypothetical protein